MVPAEPVAGARYPASAFAAGRPVLAKERLPQIRMPAV
jgi:hypothetical protein